MSEALDETTFDVDAWLEEARPPQRAVVVYGRGDLFSRLQELQAQAAAQPADGRMGGTPLEREIKALREQMEASRRVFHVRGLLHSERTELLERFRVKGQDGADDTFDAAGYEAAAFVVALVSPTLTAAQVEKLHAAIGEAQWQAISVAVETAGSEPIDVPLSRLGSETTQAS